MLTLNQRSPSGEKSKNACPATLRRSYVLLRLARDLAQVVSLPQDLDDCLELLKLHRPYCESDHVLAMTYNLLAGGACIEDLEQRRSDDMRGDAAACTVRAELSEPSTFACSRTSRPHKWRRSSISKSATTSVTESNTLPVSAVCSTMSSLASAC